MRDLLKGETIEVAKIKSLETIIFQKKEELMEWVKKGYPLVGSFILLKNGGWIQWSCVNAGCEYAFCWEKFIRPTM